MSSSIRGLTIDMNDDRARGAVTGTQARNRPATKYASMWIGGMIITLMLLFALFPSRFALHPPETANALRILLPPSLEHPMGTDINGMDIWSRVVWGARIDLLVALASTLLGGIIGTLIGTWAGYYFARPTASGWTAEVVMRAMDMLQAFPIFIIALAAVGMSGRSISNLLWVLIVLQVPIFARLARSEVVRIRSEPYIDAARCVGNGDLGVMLRHILPNAITPNIVNASTVAGSMILLTAGLSFAGAGVPAPTAEWGYMVSVGAANLFTGQWWPALFPGLFIGLAVLGFSLLGDGLRAFLDRRLQ
jgi:peptide/nickel transport system permease protein